ncbi:MAG: hypothetical protein AAF621_03730, partial [Pseudomonadota bacterium]
PVRRAYEEGVEGSQKCVSLVNCSGPGEPDYTSAILFGSVAAPTGCALGCVKGFLEGIVKNCFSLMKSARNRLGRETKVNSLVAKAIKHAVKNRISGLMSGPLNKVVKKIGEQGSPYPKDFRFQRDTQFDGKLSDMDKFVLACALSYDCVGASGCREKGMVRAAKKLAKNADTDPNVEEAATNFIKDYLGISEYYDRLGNLDETITRERVYRGETIEISKTKGDIIAGYIYKNFSKKPNKYTEPIDVFLSRMFPPIAEVTSVDEVTAVQEHL